MPNYFLISLDQKIFEKFFPIYVYIIGNAGLGPSSWWPCFLTDPYNLNNLSRGSSKDHFVASAS